ncbi:MAG: HlyD family efflux transporter periplasmic adaptor subunit [Balneolaceae bacterium]
MFHSQKTADQSAHAHFSDFSVRSRAIYNLLLVVFLTTVLLLPWIYIDIGIHTTGMIRPSVDRITIQAPQSGMIESLPRPESSQVILGDTILVIRAHPVEGELTQVLQRQQRVTNLLQDLNLLTRADSLTKAHFDTLSTSRYRRSLMEHLHRVNRITTRVNLEERRYNRSRFLADRELISQQELEEDLHQYESTILERELLSREQSYNWTLDMNDLEQERQELAARQKQLKETIDQHIVTAPVSGFIQSLFSHQPGSYLNQNQSVAEITPDSELIAELYLTPDKAGLVTTGMTAVIRLDAFDEREWGTIRGRIESISEDLTIDGDQPYYRVRCRLDQTWLELRNGVRRQIKRGMTLQARLLITKRSLFQLLFDRLDDWFNPQWKPLETISEQTIR